MPANNCRQDLSNRGWGVLAQKKLSYKCLQQPFICRESPCRYTHGDAECYPTAPWRIVVGLREFQQCCRQALHWRKRHQIIYGGHLFATICQDQLLTVCLFNNGAGFEVGKDSLLYCWQQQKADWFQWCHRLHLGTRPLNISCISNQHCRMMQRCCDKCFVDFKFDHFQQRPEPRKSWTRLLHKKDLESVLRDLYTNITLQTKKFWFKKAWRMRISHDQQICVII